MTIRFTAILIAVLAISGETRLYAQQATAGPGTLEVTLAPVGGTFFTGGNTGSSFGNYTLGAALTYNINRIVGIEAEVDDSLGISQDVQFAGLSANQKTPNALTYSANLVLSAPMHSFFPYITGGIGGLTMFQDAALGINSDATFLTGNVGAGVRWYAANGHWGLRGDYRFLAVQSYDTAPAFFGQDTRYANRVYVGVIINAIQ
jgi:hypothetical protein